MFWHLLHYENYRKITPVCMGSNITLDEGIPVECNSRSDRKNERREITDCHGREGWAFMDDKVGHAAGRN